MRSDNTSFDLLCSIEIAREQSASIPSFIHMLGRPISYLKAGPIDLSDSIRTFLYQFPGTVSCSAIAALDLIEFCTHCHGHPTQSEIDMQN